MRKQTKLVAVLSAAALLAMGASMTSFAAGWEKDDAGVWHYYDSDDEMVSDEWAKDGGKWFYLDEDGEMLTEGWVDDDYYVGADGAMLINTWIKTFADDEQDNPDDDGEHWYYFGSKGKKTVDGTKKINGKTYFFNEDGEMQYGWQEINDEGYYFGTEDEGWRTENQWLWLEKSGLLDDDDVDDGQERVFDCTDEKEEICDDEGWYWFQSSGKIYNGDAKKKINGKYYLFNDHGQMLYEWINGKAKTVGSNAQLDGKATGASASDMVYYNVVEEGWRGDGWYEIDGSEDMGKDSDTDWYYIDDGDITHAGSKDMINGIKDEDDKDIYVLRKKIKVSGNKYFAFNEAGQMQDGLQYIEADGGFFFFDENGYMKTGKVADVECEDDDYNFYFTTTNGKNGLGYTGEKDGYLYFNGKRLEADDDYRLYYVDKNFYLVNTKGKIQKATGTNGKKYDDIENTEYNGLEDVIVKTTSKGVIKSIGQEKKEKDAAALLADLVTDVKATNFDPAEDNWCSVPFIALYDDNVYTYVVKDGVLAEGWQ